MARDRPGGIAVLGPLTLLPSQFLGRRAGWTPEQTLAAAVLEDAVDTYRKGMRVERGRTRQLADEAARWIAATRNDWPFSFEAICDRLDLDAAGVRRALGTPLPNLRVVPADSSPPPCGDGLPAAAVRGRPAAEDGYEPLVRHQAVRDELARGPRTSDELAALVLGARRSSAALRKRLWRVIDQLRVRGEVVRQDDGAWARVGRAA